MKKRKMQQVIVSALCAALICLATMIFKVPIPGGGYANLGDGLVIASGYLLPASFGWLSAALGSSLADIISGYALYAPATFVIKGLMAFAAHLIYIKSRRSENFAKAIASFCAEIIMVSLYFLYEIFIYGVPAASLGIYLNICQGIIGIISSAVIVSAVRKLNYLKDFFDSGSE